MSDGEYDSLSRHIDTKVKTGNKRLDEFFSNVFEADTGMWIHKHPELNRIKCLYEKLFK
jgi:hypothetical protein